MDRKAQQNIKCVAVGDAKVGKTSIFLTYIGGKFPKDCRTIRNHSLYVPRDGVVYSLVLFDIAAGSDDKIRHLEYPGTDVVLICYDTSSPDSLESVKSKWVPEIQKHCPHTPFLLIGTKTDIQNATTTDEGDSLEGQNITGVELAKVLGCDGYFECSAMLNHGIEDIINGAIEVAISRKKSKKRKNNCIAM